MKFLQTSMLLALMTTLCSIAAAQTGTTSNEPDKPKHNQVVVEFPGHKYSLEIAVKPATETVNGEERNIPTVFAYATDAHFDPIQIETTEVRLNFVIDRKPKSFVLLPVKADPKDANNPKRPSVFELKDPELVKLISGGWTGDAEALMRVGRTPYKAKLIKAKDYKPHKH